MAASQRTTVDVPLSADMVEVPEAHGQGVRHGQILEVLGQNQHARHRVRWDEPTDRSFTQRTVSASSAACCWRSRCTRRAPPYSAPVADASSVELTRNPAGLLRALRKLQRNDEPFQNMNHATAAMCIDDPLQHHAAWYRHLYDTHPPIEQRIAALERMLVGHTV